METSPQTALALAAQAGDQMAFETLVGSYRRELLVHCYQMLGSLNDAEDLVLHHSRRDREMVCSPPAHYLHETRAEEAFPVDIESGRKDHEFARRCIKEERQGAAILPASPGENG